MMAGGDGKRQQDRWCWIIPWWWWHSCFSSLMLKVEIWSAESNMTKESGIVCQVNCHCLIRDSLLSPVLLMMQFPPWPDPIYECNPPSYSPPFSFSLRSTTRLARSNSPYSSFTFFLNLPKFIRRLASAVWSCWLISDRLSLVVLWLLSMLCCMGRVRGEADRKDLTAAVMF